VEKVSEARDDHGGIVESWSTFATVWASVEPGSSREFTAAKQVNGELTHEIRMRYLAGLTSKMRIVFGGRVFDIQPPMNVREANREMRIMATEAT
jgi:SPP1 family predicted phage head-tail adaptor